jgi:hypothetical protein
LHESGHAKFKYPFEDMEAGQGMFIPVGKGKTTDALMNEMLRALISIASKTLKWSATKTATMLWKM